MIKNLSILILCLCGCSSNLIEEKTNLLDETRMSELTSKEDLNALINLQADEDVQNLIKSANAVTVNGFRILYSKPGEIIIIKDKTVVARIGDTQRVLYNGDYAPIASNQVILKSNLIIYSNNHNDFIDYGIDGIDIVSKNDLPFLNHNKDTEKPQKTASYVNGQLCQNLHPDLSTAACCNGKGYKFSFESGWSEDSKVTMKCKV